MEAKGPLIVQGDMSILVEVDHPNYPEARDKIAPFTELVKSPEHIHTYSITPISLWNAASAGHNAKEFQQTLQDFCRYPVPGNVLSEIQNLMERYGKIRLIREGSDIVLETDSAILLKEISSSKLIQPYLAEPKSPTKAALLPMSRGLLKMELIKIGFPAEDLAGYQTGAPLEISFKEKTGDGKDFGLRDYQQEASQIFYAGGSEKGGSGVVVLPCGAGKTIVGMAAMARCQTETLILTTNVVATRQWIREILDKTTLKEEQVGEYTGANKALRPVTVATYQILTYRKKKTDKFLHFDIFHQNKWGLIVYDEVHLLPAPLFRLSADMQATRRLGLTATLVREDGKETDVFSLIGPKKYDVPWKVLEKQGWIATAHCMEYRIPLPMSEKIKYATAEMRKKIVVAACNPDKIKMVKKLLEEHRKDRVLIIGQYLEQLDQMAGWIDAPLITGKTPNPVRMEYYQKFRTGEINTLIVSKVGNFAIDLPDANVLIQISGTFGSRQEEAQRLGRVLRPKSNGSQAHFYSLVSRETREQDFAMNRQLFLTEQGYSYTIENV